MPRLTYLRLLSGDVPSVHAWTHTHTHTRTHERKRAHTHTHTHRHMPTHAKSKFTIPSPRSKSHLKSRFLSSSAVQKEVDRRRVLLPVCPRHPGEHHLRPQRAAEESRPGPGRGELHPPSLALAHRQPRNPLARHPRILKMSTRPPGCP